MHKVCINDICYKVLRLIKNGTSYDKVFLESVRDNCGADTMINDNAGNILMCIKIQTYEFNEELNKWACNDYTQSIEITENE